MILLIIQCRGPRGVISQAVVYSVNGVAYTTFYWSTILNIALSGTVFELFDVE